MLGVSVVVGIFVVALAAVAVMVWRGSLEGLGRLLLATWSVGLVLSWVTAVVVVVAVWMQRSGHR